MPWKVPDQASARRPLRLPAERLADDPLDAPRSSRRRRGARRSSAGCGRGSAPLTMRWATRWASVLVLPEPAPAMTSSGPATPPAADAMLDGPALVGIELVEIGGGHARRINRLPV